MNDVKEISNSWEVGGSTGATVFKPELSLSFLLSSFEAMTFPDSAVDLLSFNDELNSDGKPDRKFPCPWDGCGKSFLRKTDVTRHLRIHLNDRPFKCVWPDCGKAFMQRSAVKIHYRTHTGEKPNHCPFEGCSKSFNDTSSLARHRRTHHFTTPFPCSFRPCKEHFANRKLLVEHEQLVHRNIQPPANRSNDPLHLPTPQITPIRQSMPQDVPNMFLNQRLPPNDIISSRNSLYSQTIHELDYQMPKIVAPMDYKYSTLPKDQSSYAFPNSYNDRLHYFNSQMPPSNTDSFGRRNTIDFQSMPSLSHGNDIYSPNFSQGFHLQTQQYQMYPTSNMNGPISANKSPETHFQLNNPILPLPGRNNNAGSGHINSLVNSNGQSSTVNTMKSSNSGNLKPASNAPGNKMNNQPMANSNGSGMLSVNNQSNHTANLMDSLSQMNSSPSNQSGPSSPPSNDQLKSPPNNINSSNHQGSNFQAMSARLFPDRNANPSFQDGLGDAAGRLPVGMSLNQDHSNYSLSTIGENRMDNQTYNDMRGFNRFQSESYQKPNGNRARPSLRIHTNTENNYPMSMQPQTAYPILQGGASRSSPDRRFSTPMISPNPQSSSSLGPLTFDFSRFGTQDSFHSFS
ncbi:hypothetical protein HDV02_002626 [Globomyces sp. JEL0801]|nr:hypothetical protein HDV02_002626 [Globomyces sp. JEL0801]